MKKNLLLVASFFIGTGIFAQLTNDNAPAIGDGAILFAIDSLAPNYSNVVGEGVVWDYSTFGSLEETRGITVFAASDVDVNGSFPNSDLALELEGMLTSFFTSNESERIGQGFIFSDDSFGDIPVAFNEPGEKQVEYPFGYGSSLSDAFTGNTELMGMSIDFQGSVMASVDGVGTLKLADNDYENVLRYSISEEIEMEAPFVGEVILNRVQYDYYDHSISNLPIFIYASVVIAPAEGGDALMAQTVILSSEEPSFSIVGLDKNILEGVSVYPNPTSDVININLPSGVDKASVTVLDVLGKEVLTTELNSSLSTLNVSTLNKGNYFVKIQRNNNSIVKKVVVK